MFKALVTGADGYVGRALLPNLSCAIPVDIHNYFNNKDLIICDLTDLSKTKALFRVTSPDVVVHLAGRKSVSESIHNPIDYYHSNVVSSLNLIKLCEDYKIPMVFASTAAVYTEPTPYSESKLFIEKCLKESSIDFRILRYFNIGGLVEPPSPAQVGNVFDILREKLNSGSCFNLNLGSLPRDYTHVADVAAVTLDAIGSVMEYGGQVSYDVLSGVSYSLHDVVKEYSNNGIEVLYKEIQSSLESRTASPDRPYPFTTSFSLADIVRSEIELGLTISKFS